MKIDEFLKLCRSADRIICYGAGVWARDLTVFLKWNKVNIEAYCVSAPDKTIETIDDKPVIGTGDIKDYSGAFIIVSVNPAYHDEIRTALAHANKKGIFIDDEMYRMICEENKKAGWQARGWILYNTPLKNLVSETQCKEYENRIKEIKEKFSSIEIRYAKAYNIAGLTESLCYYSDMHRSNHVFFLLYPTGSLPDGTVYFRKFIYPNRFVLESFHGDFYEVINSRNLMFWKYFLEKYPDMFKDNLDRDFWYKYKKGRLNKNRKGFVGVHGKRYIDFTEDENDEGKRILEKWEIRQPYICISSRDSAYTQEELGRREPFRKWMDEFRNSDIRKFEPLCKKFQEMGYKIVRIGHKVHIKVDFPGCIDYANKFRSPFMDAYINAKCEFEIGDNSGIQSFASLVNKPFVMINTPQVGVHFLDPINPIFYERDLLIMEKLWDSKRNKYLTMREIMEYERESTKIDGVDMHSLWKLYHERGIVPVKNTPEEILDAALEMHGRIHGTYEYDSLDEELHQRYVEIAKEANEDDHWFWLPVRMGAKFLRQNQWLLE